MGESFGTSPTGINDSSQIVGFFPTGRQGTTVLTSGFLYTGGIFTIIDVPGGVNGTAATGINDSGQIVGSFTDASGSTHGVLDTGGSFTTIDVPGATLTGASAINNSSQIVGEFSTGLEHGFLATPAPVPEPSTLLTLATGLVALFAMAWHRKSASAGDLEH